MKKDRAHNKNRVIKRDETHVLGDMGKALGWSRQEYKGNTTAINDAKESVSIKNEAAGIPTHGPSEYAPVGKAHVKVKNG